MVLIIRHLLHFDADFADVKNISFEQYSQKFAVIMVAVMNRVECLGSLWRVITWF